MAFPPTVTPPASVCETCRWWQTTTAFRLLQSTRTKLHTDNQAITRDAAHSLGSRHSAQGRPGPARPDQTARLDGPDRPADIRSPGSNRLERVGLSERNQPFRQQ